MKRNTFMTQKQLAEDYDICTRTVKSRISEIRQQKRYNTKDIPVIDDGNIVMVNHLVWVDYMANRQALRHGCKVAPYDPEAVYRALGGADFIMPETKPQVVMPDEKQIEKIVKDLLRNLFV